MTMLDWQTFVLQRRINRPSAEVLHAIALNQPKVLPVSTQLNGEYGIRKTCLSLPTELNRSGVVRRYEVELWPREIAGIYKSAAALDATYAQVQK